MDVERGACPLVYGNSFTSTRTGYTLFLEKWGRVLISHTVFAAALVLWSLISVILVPGALVFGILKKKGLLYLRAWGVITTYLVGEIIALISLYAMAFRHIAMEGDAYLSPRFRASFLRYGMWWCASMCRIFHLVLGKQAYVQGDFVPERPVVAAVQHVSTNDVLLVPWLLGYRHQLNMRIVMKKELMWDPGTELFGTGSGCFFIDRTQKGETEGIALIMSSRGNQDVDNRFNGSIIFPEGTRMTVARRKKILGSMKKDSPLYEYARSLRATLPPRLGGLLALLRTGGADLVFVGHVGYDGATDMASILSGGGGGIFYSPLSVRVWRIPADCIPDTDAAKTELILRCWKELDDWVFEERQLRLEEDEEEYERHLASRANAFPTTSFLV